MNDCVQSESWSAPVRTLTHQVSVRVTSSSGAAENPAETRSFWDFFRFAQQLQGVASESGAFLKRHNLVLRRTGAL